MFHEGESFKFDEDTYILLLSLHNDLLWSVTMMPVSVCFVGEEEEGPSFVVTIVKATTLLSVRVLCMVWYGS